MIDSGGYPLVSTDRIPPSTKSPTTSIFSVSTYTTQTTRWFGIVLSTQPPDAIISELQKQTTNYNYQKNY